MRDKHGFLNLLAFGINLVLVLMFTTALFLSVKTESKAAYKYTIRLYPGKQGTFNTDKAKSILGSSFESVACHKDVIVIKTDNYNDKHFTLFDDSMVNVTDSSRYVVHGLRESGTDNTTVNSKQNPSQKIQGDRDYVVAYKIVTELVDYTINFKDTDGNTILESRSSSGNVGDSIVLAFPYIKGYVPKAYNGKINLSDDEDKNTFTFRYRKVASSDDDDDDDDSSSSDSSTKSTSSTSSSSSTGSTNSSTDEETTEDKDDNEETEEVIDIDSDEIPQASFDGENEEDSTEDAAESFEMEDGDTGMSLPVKILLGAAGVLAVLGIGIFASRKMRKED